MARLLGIFRAQTKHGPQLELEKAVLDPVSGLGGDHRGKRARRQVSVLFLEGWEAVCAELGERLPWTVRRANLLVEGIPTPREGAKLLIGGAALEVIQETKPCHWMEAARPGLRAAMTPDWRGGVCCCVLQGADIRLGDEVRLA